VNIIENSADIPYPTLLEHCDHISLQGILLCHLDLIHYTHLKTNSIYSWRARPTIIDQSIDNVMHLAIHFCQPLHNPLALIACRQAVFDNLNYILNIDTDTLPVIILMVALGKWRVQANITTLKSFSAYTDKYSSILFKLQEISRQE
jgi:hypothetical protein